MSQVASNISCSNGLKILTKMVLGVDARGRGGTSIRHDTGIFLALL